MQTLPVLMEIVDALDKSLGNEAGWSEFSRKTDQQGAATTVYAAFEPSLRGEMAVSGVRSLANVHRA